MKKAVVRKDKILHTNQYSSVEPEYTQFSVPTSSAE